MLIKLKYLVFFLSLTHLTTAWAYVDPGSTLLMIQGLLAFIGGVVVFAKSPVKTIKEWIAKIKARNRA